MASAHCDPGSGGSPLALHDPARRVRFGAAVPAQRSAPPDVLAPRPVTVVGVALVGGPAAGKTTLLGALTGRPPISVRGCGPDRLDLLEIDLPEGLRVSLLAAADGPDAEVALEDAVAAVVLIDTRRLAETFAAVDRAEASGRPFVVAVNCFDGIATHALDDVREALGLGPGVPVLYTDARSTPAARQVLATAVHQALIATSSG